MNSVLSINEGATSIALKAPSNLVKLERHQMWDKSSTEPHHLVNPPSRSQRCFPQFDRKTDCFVMLMRDSAWDVPVGLLSTGCMVTAPARGCGLNGSGQRAIAEARLSGGESDQHCKAVCGTQTRHGVSVNKHQADSQNYASYSGKQLVRLARKLWIAILASNGGSIPSAGLTWQKHCNRTEYCPISAVHNGTPTGGKRSLSKRLVMIPNVEKA